MSLIMNKLALKARVLANEIKLLRSQIKQAEECSVFAGERVAEKGDARPKGAGARHAPRHHGALAQRSLIQQSRRSQMARTTRTRKSSMSKRRMGEIALLLVQENVERSGMLKMFRILRSRGIDFKGIVQRCRRCGDSALNARTRRLLGSLSKKTGVSREEIEVFVVNLVVRIFEKMSTPAKKRRPASRRGEREDLVLDHRDNS